MSDKLNPGALLNMHGDTETWEEATVRVSHERDELRAEVERLRAVLEQIAGGYYHDAHAILAREALIGLAERSAAGQPPA